MRYMLLIYGEEGAWSEAEREECYRESAQLAQRLQTAGQYLAAAPLHPVATATSVRVRDGKRLVTDGPFAETREQLGGYYLVEARDLDEALAIAARIPPARRGTVEIRPVKEIGGLPEERPRSCGTEVDARLARPGGLSYLEIPAADLRQSAAFYEKVLGWKVEWRGSDDPRFEDPTGHLIGRWVTGRAISEDAGLLPYVYVERIDDVVERAKADGGTVIRAPYPEGNLWVAIVRDPAGNRIGLWQAGPR